ncbi:anhydro-N-acetylmuramic acid kinase [Nocardioides sp. YR527]|uniref:anhydro-N-acetylmuramic acid kinase n=1 Tax=Nocardioides sp. YR527 TaxID=1881028 RepID=UPI0008819090|nr:anhydro-N-acetylmuramic acid kinase [Nocardioides sp. YR527]SDJ69690.1 anhydro-N-acetylmuramic acid kinase [Nocardioides sp. YR527]
MRVLGMISGTSHDGIDVAIVDFAFDVDIDADVLRARIVHHSSVPYPPDLRERLIEALPPAPVGFDVVCELDTRIGQAFAAAARQAVEEAGSVDVVCTHGQTAYHWVESGRALGTLQIGQPAWIAEATGATVVSDVRSADIAAGGQGAPLVPLLDVRMLAPLAEDGTVAAALNLGGIANITVRRPAADPVAWDIGPANALIDAVVTDAPGEAGFDRDGELAAAGTVIPVLLADLLDSPFFGQPAPKSTGKELFNLDYVRAGLARTGLDPSLPDLVATLTEVTAVSVSQAVAQAGVEVLVASGGGVRNPVLMRRLGDLLPGVRVITSDALGVPSDTKEAIAFALIGWASVHSLAGNVPSCTGAIGPRVLGQIIPTSAPPPPIGAWPATLVFER